MWGFLIALLSGALMSLQGVLNTEVTKQSGVWLCAVWVQLTALAYNESPPGTSPNGLVPDLTVRYI